MDPDEVSGSEEGEEEEWGAGASNGFVQPDSDDDDDDDDEDEDEANVPHEGAEEGAANPSGADDDDLPAEEEEEEEDDDDDDPPPSKAPAKSMLTSFFAAKPKTAAPASTSKAASTSKPPAAKSTASTSKAGAAKPNKTKPNEPPSKPKPKAKTYTPHSEGSDDEGPLGLVPPKNPGVPMPAPDAIAEFEQHRAAASRDAPAGATAAAEPAASVHASALDFVYVMKNEKVNKFWEVNPIAFVHAPDLGAVDLLCFSMEDLTIPSKRDRLAMQEALCDKEGTKVVSTAAIAEIKTDGSGSGTGPGTNPVMMVVPYNPVFGEAELEDLRVKLEKVKPGRRDRRIVGLLALDTDLSKRAYAINKCPLPAMHNPNTNSSNKYKVPSKLEDIAKVDDNFTYIGPVEKAKRATKRGGEESAAKSDGKRAAAAAAGQQQQQQQQQASSANGTSARHPDRAAEAEGVEPQARIWLAETPVAEVMCASNEALTLVRAPVSGRYFVIKTPA